MLKKHNKGWQNILPAFIVKISQLTTLCRALHKKNKKSSPPEGGEATIQFIINQVFLLNYHISQGATIGIYAIDSLNLVAHALQIAN